MTKKIFYCLLTIILVNSSFAQQVQKIDGQVEKATFYYSGVSITENYNYNFKAGDNYLIVNNLPTDIDINRIMVQIPKGLELISMNLNPFQSDEMESFPEIKSINDSLKNLEQFDKLNSYKFQALNLELELLKKNISIGGENTGVNISELTKAGDYYRTRQEDIYQKLFVVENKLNENKIIRNVLLVRKQNIMSKIQNLSGQVKLCLRSEIAALKSFKLEYYTFKGAWKTIYDIKIEEVGKPLKIVHKGKIMNITGKDLKNIVVNLSTADPSLSIIKPDLPTWELNYQTNNYNSYKYKLGNQQIEDKTLYNSTPQKAEWNQNVMQTNMVEVSEMSNDFFLKDVHTFFNNTTTNTVEIDVYEMAAFYEYYAIPEVSLMPYLVAKTTEWNKFPISDGDANIYLGNLLLGNSEIKLSEVSDTLEISLGRNKKVMVDKKKKIDKTSKTFLSNQIKETFTYEINIKNNNPNAIILNLIDQVPVSLNSEIEVEILNISGAKHDINTGKLEWLFNLKPGEETKVIISFTVKYPKGKEVKVKRFKPIMCPTF